jgi:hypothetical protein
VDLPRLFAQLNASGFQDVAGARVSARVPISSALLNQIIRDALRGSSGPVRSVDVGPLAGDRFEVVITTTLPFVPALTVQVAIDEQPRFPASPFLVLRWSFLGGVGTFASRFVGRLEHKLPPGIRLDADRIVIDLPVMIGRSAPPGAVEWLRYLMRFELHTVDDRAIVDLEAGIS